MKYCVNILYKTDILYTVPLKFNAVIIFDSLYVRLYIRLYVREAQHVRLRVANNRLDLEAQLFHTR